MTQQFFIYAAINIFVALVSAPFFMGVIKKVKALCQGRHGPQLLQPYYNLIKLFSKEVVVSKDSSWITRITPYINMSIMVLAVLFIPLIFVPVNNTVFGNIILLIYLFAIAKFFMALAGLDAGSAFGGMGSSREMSFSSIIEPVTIIVFLALAFVFKTTNLFDITRETAMHNIFSINPLLVLLAVSLFIILITESSRIPVDNPETHLELTMIHEAMLLEQSGKNLALMEWSSALKQTILMAILINIFFPVGLIPINLITQSSPMLLLVSAFLFLVKGIALSVVIALFESYLAKLRLFLLPTLFAIPFFLAFLTIVIEVFI